jgi:hypothetical protein
MPAQIQSLPRKTKSLNVLPLDAVYSPYFLKDMYNPSSIMVL